jgi:hypothetical protein
MFMTGDRSTWCVLVRGINLFSGTASLDAMTTNVVASSGTVIGAGGSTNVLARAGVLEDPLIGCEGTHLQNNAKLLYAEDAVPVHLGFKDAHGGIDVYIR